MIKIKENCFNNNKIIQFDEPKEELLIFNKLIVNEQLINYLETIIIDDDNKDITFTLFNPSNNLKFQFCCVSYFNFKYLQIFNSNSYQSIASINNDGLVKLDEYAHENLFLFFKEIFLNDINCGLLQ